MGDIQDIDSLITMATCAVKAEEAVENEDWARAIDLYKEARENFPPELDNGSRHFLGGNPR